MIPQEGRIADLILAAFYGFMRLVPSEWASWIGSYGIRRNAWANRPETIEGARKNLRFHRPDASPAEIDAMVDAFLDGVGRVAGEFAVAHRFMKEGRIRVTGLEHLKGIAGTRPVVALCVHTGNWEVFSPVFQAAGVKLNSIIMPPVTAFERFAVDRTRRKFDVEPILPDIPGIRKAIRLLKENGLVSMFPDEARDGISMAPLFGRPPHEKGNLAIAARLARMTGAGFILGHCRRRDSCQFDLAFSEAFDLPQRSGHDLMADVLFLNDRIEPIIRENIPRWYFLDDSLEIVAAENPRNSDG